MRVEYTGDAEGLASVIGSLIQQNLERDPDRCRLLRASVVAIEARDAEVSVTLRMFPGRIEVAAGADPEADVRLVADSTELLRMAGAPLRFGFPDALDPEGRDVIRDILSGRVRVRGLLRHPRSVSRLSRLLSAR